jgi:hypothetical protein
LEPSWVYYGGRTIHEISVAAPGGKRLAAEQAGAFLAETADAYLITTQDRLKELDLFLPQDVGVVQEADYFLRQGDRLVVLGRNASPLGVVTGRGDVPTVHNDLR